MKTIEFVAYLFYKYYSTGPTRRIPYFSTLCALVMIIGIHLFQVLILLDRVDIIPTDGSQRKIGNFLRMALFIAPIFLIVSLIIKRSNLEKMHDHYSKEKVKKGYVWLIGYIVISFALLVFLILYKKGRI